ncbi:MAG: HAMP domain-containing sensor histidine kinase [Thermodesulfobacteriota bacterium]|nr:HAMP domain-containing sensor histidine kinase [Thermodesulfobacteriota bacterium]
MKRTLWFIHPVAIFVYSIIALVLSLFLYIYWYVEVSSGLQRVIAKTNLDAEQFVAWQTWVVIMILSILVAIILLGIILVFVYQRKTLALYRSQHKFINSFTHELKTPVTSLQLYLETMNRVELPRDKQKKYLGYMLDDVSRLTNNINGILNLARLEAKVQGVEFVVVDLVEEVVEFYRKNEQLFRESNILVNKSVGQRYFCSINHSLFQMMLMNLLSNGIRYNENDRPQITVSFSQTENNVQLTIADNGVGFEKFQARKVFKKFFQIEQQDLTHAGGTGLGLYMVDQVVRLHKGKVTAHSDGPGKGSQFVVSLPRVEAEV